jgi:hypothetical protein
MGLTLATSRRFLCKPDRRDRQQEERGEMVRGSIALILCGAVLYFATDLRVAGVGIDFVWLIPMLAGLAGLLVELVDEGFWSRRRSRRAT